MSSAVTQTPPSSAPQQSDRILNLMAWFEVHRNHLMGALLLIVIAFAGVYLWRHFGEQREARANAALLEIRAKPSDPESAPTAADYLKVATEHPSTVAAYRARLLAAGAFFVEGRFSESLTEFQKVQDEGRSDVLTAQAAFGVAASLDALGKTDEAVARYRDVLNRYADSSVATESRLALARIEEGKQQPASALRLYDEILREREPSPFTQQAESLRQDLLRKFPQLNETNAPAAVTQ